MNRDTDELDRRVVPGVLHRQPGAGEKVGRIKAGKFKVPKNTGEKDNSGAKLEMEN